MKNHMRFIRYSFITILSLLLVNVDSFGSGLIFQKNDTTVMTMDDNGNLTLSGHLEKYSPGNPPSGALSIDFAGDAMFPAGAKLWPQKTGNDL